MPTATSASVDDGIARVAGQGLPARELFAEVARRVRRVVPYTAAGWLSTDPATMLFTDVYGENLAGAANLQLFENELTAPDFAKFADLVRARRAAQVLTEATGGEPELSARHRTIHRPLGLRSELRAVFATGATCWGAVCLARAEGEPDFTAADATLLASIAHHVTHGLRTALLMTAAETPAEQAPGMVILGEGDHIESATPEAERWLAELGAGADELPLPSPVVSVAMRARAMAEGADTLPRARVRSAGGQWLLLHASMLRGGPRDGVAVMIEPARRVEIASILVEAHGLTERERQVTALLTRGLSTEEIAQTLWLSRHTVRDHVKAVFEKTGVSTRGELTAKLFAEHYAPPLKATARHVDGE
ncbi:MAG TPA: helix-turn-helix transcriptional regulator [Gaiellaceae bacterium]|nr:helix-turn-helix transcriptional regulator [Gaiellaceae bacterium]